MKFSTNPSLVSVLGFGRFAEVAESTKDHGGLKPKQYKESFGGISVVSNETPSTSDLPTRPTRRAQHTSESTFLERPRLRD